MRFLTGIDKTMYLCYTANII